MLAFKNPKATRTAKGSLAAGASATILTQAQTERGIRIEGVVQGLSTSQAQLSIGGSVVMTGDPTSHRLQLPISRIVNEAVVVTAGAGSGTIYYTITYEWE